MPQTTLQAEKAKLDAEKHETKANICQYCGALRIGGGPRSRTTKYTCRLCSAEMHASDVIRALRLENPELASIKEREFNEKKRARQEQGRQYMDKCKAVEKTATEKSIDKEVNAKVSSWYSRARLSGLDFRHQKATFLKDIRDVYKAKGEKYAIKKLNEDKRHNALTTKFGI